MISYKRKLKSLHLRYLKYFRQKVKLRKLRLKLLCLQTLKFYLAKYIALCFKYYDINKTCMIVVVQTQK